MRVLILDRVRDAHRDPAERVDDVDESAEADLHVAVDPQPGVLLDGPHQQLRAAEGEGGVDLVLSLAGNGNVAVPRDRDQRRPTARRDVHDHHRVGPLADFTAGAELVALRTRQPLPGVRTDQQERGPRLRRRPLAGGGVVDPLDLAPGVQRHRDEPGDRGQHDQDHHDQDIPDRVPLLGRHGRGDQRSGGWTLAGWTLDRRTLAGRPPAVSRHRPVLGRPVLGRLILGRLILGRLIPGGVERRAPFRTGAVRPRRAGRWRRGRTCSSGGSGRHGAPERRHHLGRLGCGRRRLLPAVQPVEVLVTAWHISEGTCRRADDPVTKGRRPRRGTPSRAARRGDTDSQPPARSFPVPKGSYTCRLSWTTPAPPPVAPRTRATTIVGTFRPDCPDRTGAASG